MSNWWTGGALGFDTETDGPEPTEARIITAALVSLSPGVDPVQMEQMLEPERDIPAGAVAIHGITTERAKAEGVMREMGIAQIAATIAELAGAERPLVGHNVVYDLTLLDREMRRTGVGRLSLAGFTEPTGPVVLWLADERVAAFNVIDTLVLDKAVDKYRRGSRKLVDVAAYYGVPMAEGSAHGATADVLASLRIAWKIAKKYADHPVGAMTLADLHDAQARWAAEQADGLREYFRRTGKNADDVSGEWPVRLTRGDDEDE